MKKITIFILVIAFMVSVASLAFGRTMEEEKAAVRDYLNVVDAKLATAKQANDTTKIDLLHAEKTATLDRWYKLQAQMETAKPPQVVVVTTHSTEVVTVTNTKEVGRGVALWPHSPFAPRHFCDERTARTRRTGAGGHVQYSGGARRSNPGLSREV